MAFVMLSVGLFVFAAYLFRGVFERTGVPDVLLLLLCGMALGPWLGWVAPGDFGQAGKSLATMALVLILFEGGVDLNLKALREAIGPTLKLAVATFIATVLIVMGIAIWLASMAWLPALMLGVILGGTSSAVVIPLVQGLNIQGKARTVLVLESALTDVLCIVGLFVLLEAARIGQASTGHVLLSILETMGLAVVIGIAAGLGWLFLTRFARKLPHGGFAPAAMCFIVYGVVELLGFSGAIAALSFGLALSNGRQIFSIVPALDTEKLAQFSASEQSFLQEMIFVLKTFFFVYLGISMQIGSTEIVLIGAAMVLTVYSVRHLLVAFAVDTDIARPDVATMAGMVPKGLAAAVLAALPLEQGVVGGQAIQDIAYVVVLLSIAMTALLVAAQRVAPIQRVYGMVYRRFPGTRND